jgi:uncharacterized protein (DUF983 family)
MGENREPYTGHQTKPTQPRRSSRVTVETMSVCCSASGEPREPGTSNVPVSLHTERVMHANLGSKQSRCPVCGSGIPWNELGGPSVRCFSCSTELRISRLYSGVIAAISLALDLGLLYAFGATDMSFVFGILLLFLPTMALVLLVVRRIIPPPLQQTGTSLNL